MPPNQPDQTPKNQILPPSPPVFTTPTTNPPINTNSEPAISELTPYELSKRSMPKFGKVLFIILFTTISVILLSLSIVYFLKHLSEQEQKNKNPIEATHHYSHLNLQPTINLWLNNQTNKKNHSLLLYDFDNQEIIGRNNDFPQVNSLGVENLFLVYFNYQKLEQGIYQMADKIQLSGQEALRPETVTRDFCLTKLIQENHLACQSALINEIGSDNLKQLLKDQTYSNTNFSEHLSTPSDLLKLAQRILKHPDFSDQLWQNLKAKLASQVPPLNSFPATFSTVQTFGLSGRPLNDPTSPNPNLTYYNNLYFLEVKTEYQKDKRTFLIICLATDVDPTNLTELIQNIETELLKTKSSQ